MPYKSVRDLPRPVKRSLTVEGQRAYKEAFNSALHDYQGDEGRAARVAWTAAKRAGGYLSGTGQD